MKALPDSVQSQLDKLEPAFRSAFLEAISTITNAVQLGVVIGHIENGRIDQAVQALRLEQAFFDPMGRMIGEAFNQGGRAAIANLPAIKDPFPVREGSSSLLRAVVRALNPGLETTLFR